MRRGLWRGISILPPGRGRAVDLVVPFYQEARSVGEEFDADAAACGRGTATRDWHQRLDRVDLHLPPAADPLVKTFKTAIAHILINRDGPAIQPGSRSYARTWIRDGSLTSSALLRSGQRTRSASFIEWFAPYQFAERQGPLLRGRPRRRSRAGERQPRRIHLPGRRVLALHRTTARTLETVWPHVEKAVAYIDELRRQRRTDEYRQPAKLRYFGLLPESISHEGYSSNPCTPTGTTSSPSRV